MSINPSARITKGMDEMRVGQGIEAALSRLADFMNAVHSELSWDQWERWRAGEKAQFERSQPNEDMGMPLPLDISIEEAKTIHGELHQVLHALCAGPHQLPEGIGKGLRDRLHVSTSNLIGTILAKLDAVQFQWAPRRVNSGGTLIQRGDKKERWVVELIPVSMDARKMLYYILAESIRLGAISFLKICPSATCRKYFVTKDPRQHFCARYCRFKFNNHQRTDRKNKRKATQITGREETLQKARQLLDIGKSFSVIKAETGLSDRAIESLFKER